MQRHLAGYLDSVFIKKYVAPILPVRTWGSSKRDLASSTWGSRKAALRVYVGSSLDRASQRGTLKSYLRPLGENSMDDSVNNDISNVPKPLRPEH